MEQISHFFQHLFDISSFPPRWFCGQWTGFHGWLYIVASLGIWAAYTSIPLWLAIFVTRRKDVPFLKIFWLFVAFILLCGITHLLDALTFWWPIYRVNAIVLMITAVVSLVTVLALIPVLPQAFALRSPAELEKEIKNKEKVEKALRDNEARFRQLVSGIQDYGIFRLDPQGIVVTWNEGAERIQGFTAEEITGRHFSNFYPPEDIERGKPQRELEVARTEGRFEEEAWRLRKDGSRFWANVIVTPILGEQGDVLGFSKVVRDLTERMRAEEELNRTTEELREQTRQLQAVNRELEAFSYSVSHDLRSPLRSMDGYSQALLEDYGDRLDAEGRHYLERIRLGSQRMAQLIDDLLNLAQVTRIELQPAEVDLSAMASDIAEELRELEPGREVNFEIHPGLKTAGDSRLLRILMLNLLGNAWKFTRDRKPAVIEFGSRTEKGRTVYFVKDNGVGFDMAYADKLFGAFHRLHGAEFPGTGIGLATVQRVLARHGGTIRAESMPGQGAVFSFEIDPDRLAGALESPASEAGAFSSGTGMV